MMATYAPSAQISWSLGNSLCTRCSRTLAPSRSCMSAGRTTKPQIKPSVSTSTCRLRPAIFFPRVVALGSAGFGRLHRLAVNHGSAGRFLAMVGLTQVHPQNVVDSLPHTAVAPRIEVVRYRLPRREVVRQHPPGAAAAGQVEHRIDDLAHRIGTRASGLAAPLGKQVFDVRPLGIREITGITLPCIHAQRVTETAARREADFLDGLSVLSTQYSVLSTQYSVLSTQYSVLGTRYSVLSTRYSVLGTQYRTRYSVLGTQYSVLSTPNSLAQSLVRSP